MIGSFCGEKDLWKDSTTGRMHGDGTCAETIGGCWQVLYNVPAVWVPVGSRGDGGYWDIVCNGCTRSGVAAGFKSHARPAPPHSPVPVSGAGLSRPYPRRSDTDAA